MTTGDAPPPVAMGHRWRLILLVVVAMAFVTGHPIAALAPVPGDPLVLAHYYIWFDATSWNRAKIDFPAEGRYTSDQQSVMRSHIELAKSVGIDGFIVSWKSTEVLDPRLEMLIATAEELNFKLEITYQGLDFNRDPLPIARVAADLDLFLERFADSPVFDLFGKPLVVWTGTWMYSAEEIASVTSSHEELLILGSEKNVEGYERIADVVDGDLYYWSSVDPNVYPKYPGKLIDMADAVRQHGGIWIAPVAPGYDGQLLGGERVVDRADGATLRAEWNGALASVPDAIGIISWNEFSENTHIEPSLGHGNAAVQTVAALTKSTVPERLSFDFDSDGPVGAGSTGRIDKIVRVSALVAFVAAFGLSLFVVRRRDRRPVVRPQQP